MNPGAERRVFRERRLFGKWEEWPMDPMDLIRDKFSQDCTIETVLHLLMAHFEMSEEEARAQIDEYFEIVEEIDRRRGETT